MKTQVLAAEVCLLVATPALAQEAMFTDAATMPSPGVGIWRPQFMYIERGSDPVGGETSTTEFVTEQVVAYGIDRGWALYATVQAGFEREFSEAGGADTDQGVDDFDIEAKYRFYMDNPGGVDTTRAALIFGARVASGDDTDFSSESVNPHVGAVLTIVRGVWGFNQDLHYTWNTGGARGKNEGGEGPDDAIAFNSSVVYRFTDFDKDSGGAWYLTGEVNNLYETNGDFEARWAPGLMYESPRFSFEVMAQFPLYQDLDERAELDLSVGVGFRLTF